MSAIEVTNLVKEFGGVRVVDGVSFSVNEGEVFGLIGPNGAGKSTTLRMISTLLQITSGTITMFGHDVETEPNEVRKILSYLPEESGAYKDLTGKAYLDFFSRFFGDGKAAQEIAERGKNISGLGDRLNDKISTYSKGMTRRLLVGRALMFKPKLAILDELTSGLDVISAQKVRATVKQTTKEGTTVIVSSHNMLEVELICDRIALIAKGKILEIGTPQDLKVKYDASNIEEVFVKVVG
ncbi:ABC transporter ATP-binding protein [Candidatus Methanomassiliicoccus intestinalis]|jgi:natA-like ABC-type transport protein, ATPase component|uniref:ABC-type sodium efflux pump systemATPase n=2 Tax=Candidatus Methanomassiliicoccus intestinalis TaxID=1406512 RepID=R9T672_METII|nr:ABC transporter ATP-binding protein [Candidatus Methanomassiliicoccus intestinalis]AGN26190.1 ABC-type sodium efflux pump systemATPase [Candidatus Methanomassiliicoccus intestinalis Issoire-Mx1]TQS82302.1 MAG: multidrug ABC transporter ATP-binding protein [Candidatus Methanomassiliicoccus intestinalis]TQS84731.1 MAG: multidrug ABC transporter ATP-binding protein [Candidatus Methanomassiliicoccus intestinalis]